MLRDLVFCFFITSRAALFCIRCNRMDHLPEEVNAKFKIETSWQNGQRRCPIRQTQTKIRSGSVPGQKGAGIIYISKTSWLNGTGQKGREQDRDRYAHQAQHQENIMAQWNRTERERTGQRQVCTPGSTPGKHQGLMEQHRKVVASFTPVKHHG